jgi:hypothetical protein
VPPLPFPIETTPMLETFTRETFQPHVGQRFRVIVDEQREMRTELTEVNALGDAAVGGSSRTPFSLLFTAPPRVVIPQATYRIESDVLDPFELFLVPVSSDDAGTQYEAVFT